MSRDNSDLVNPPPPGVGIVRLPVAEVNVNLVDSLGTGGLFAMMVPIDGSDNATSVFIVSRCWEHMVAVMSASKLYDEEFTPFWPLPVSRLRVLLSPRLKDSSSPRPNCRLCQDNIFVSNSGL